MAFVVEDGTGLTNSNSYASVAFADSYHADRQHGSWTALGSPQKQACLIRATDYIDKRFGKRFRGVRQSKDQARQWPRLDAWDDSRFILDDVPTAIQQATVEYALRAALYGELAPDPIPVVPRQDLTPDEPEIPTEFTGGIVTRTSEKVDVIEDTKSYLKPQDLATASKGKPPMSSTVTDAFIPEYPAADLLLEQVIKGNNQRRLRRGD